MSKDILSTEQVAACQERIKNLKTRPNWPNTRWFADVEFETCLNTVEQIQAELAAEQEAVKALTIFHEDAKKQIKDWTDRWNELREKNEELILFKETAHEMYPTRMLIVDGACDFAKEQTVKEKP